jgi:CheY-like chemotaxis protein
MPGKILIVEDHPDSRDILAIQLRLMSYEVIEAVDGKEGIEKAQAENPNLIIMDLGLPGINGIETTVKLKQNSKTAHIPVIALTAWQEQDYKDKALQAGMAGFLSKPTPPRILKDVIEDLLQGRS